MNRKFNRYSKHRTSMFRTLSKQLIQYGRIETTLTKAKDLRSVVEKLITKAKNGHMNEDKKLAMIRLIASRLHNDEQTALKLVNEIAPRFVDRQGGYTRIIPTGFRVGDRAKKAIIQILQ